MLPRSINTGWCFWALIILIQAAVILNIYSDTPLTGVYTENSPIPQQHLEGTPGPAPYTLEPNITVELQTIGPVEKTYLVETNAAGLRDSAFPTGSKDNQTLVAVVGDSMTFGWGVNKTSRLTERCEAQLQTSGRNLRLVNLGVPGYGMADYRDIIREKVVKLDPDMIAVVFSGGDRFSAVKGTNISMNDNGYKRAMRKWEEVNRQDISESALPELMSEISEQEDTRSIPKVFISYWRFTPGDREYLENWAAARENSSFVPATSSFNNKPMDEFIFSKEDPHLTAEGHKRLAETLCRQVNEKVELSS